MNLPNDRIIPVSEARARLSGLLDQLKGDHYFLLTRGGKPKAALVDIDFLEKLRADLENAYQKTFIDPKLLPLTRRFTKKEIDKWQKADKL